MAEGCKLLMRKPDHCLIFGLPKRMSLNMLPTVEDLLMEYQWVRLGLRTHPKKEPSGLSDRAAAEIASSVLQDYGLIRADALGEVIDRSKIRREINKYRESLQAESASTSIDLGALYFDGRKDKTLIQVKAGGRFHRKIVVEEHISLIKEPDSMYLGHISPSCGTADSIKKSIIDFFERKTLNVEKLVVVGCDGTAVNTGRQGGIIRLLEKHFKHPLQWLICLLHSNELPLRHLFRYLDGKTSGPQCYSGYVGKLLEQCDKMPVLDFQQIECDDLGLLQLSGNILCDLSTDQRYLYDMYQAVASGTCSEPLAHRSPGTLVMSRWLTMANCILRLYVATAQPSDTLKIMTEFIMRVYVPVWFSIKSKPSCKDGARHMWMLISKSRYLSEDLKSIIDPVIQRNAFYAQLHILKTCFSP